jgi:hypothetical protein
MVKLRNKIKKTVLIIKIHAFIDYLCLVAEDSFENLLKYFTDPESIDIDLINVH